MSGMHSLVPRLPHNIEKSREPGDEAMVCTCGVCAACFSGHCTSVHSILWSQKVFQNSTISK